MSELVTRRIRVYGIVQGVGFRPTVSRLADSVGVRGTVCNKGPYVEVVSQGTAQQVDGFVRLLRERPPRRASIVRMDVADVPTRNAGTYERFDIVESEHTRGQAYVSPDIAICDDCKRELFDPKNRRYLHPFINCTCCGPRLTILDSLPYDRERTTMRKFPMCPECAREYRDPSSRRYDAQPVCCNDCGPQVYLMGRPERGAAAITEARRAIAAGGIVAVKGIGGFHLCCDATNERAVAALRARKHRPQKPFAVMAQDEDVALRECVATPEQLEVLTGHQKPIVLLRRRSTSALAASVAPDNPRVGVMLPYAPVQLLLFDYPDQVGMPDVLVMTSANVSGAPICHDDEDVRQQLVGVCDLVLSNDRPILTRADDSVMDFWHDRPYMIRRSRGYAPLPVALSDDLGHEVLAVGGDLKNAFCVGKGPLMYLSAYVGDLGDPRGVDVLRQTIRRMGRLLESAPEVVACDLHPRYSSVAVAHEVARQLGVGVMGVQHHYAHVVSCMAENDRRGLVLGVSFDGTGYGTDGTVWGGELMACSWHGFRRLGSVAPFLQTGGDRSSLEGWRVAASMACDLASDDGEALALMARLGLCDERTARAQLAMRRHRLNSVMSTSAGRLFDAASAVLGIRRASTFEGEASCALQYAAQRHIQACPHDPWRWEAEPFRVGPDGFVTLATDALMGQLVRGRLVGEEPDVLAWRFHAGLADQVAAACERLAQSEDLDTVALSGGCLQNTLFLDLVSERLQKADLQVLTHSLVPPNDGGIALGQAVVAAQALADGRIDLDGFAGGELGASQETPQP
ncbi:MAG: carbamoyltransferase HypF [Atopobiaceae bacterium]